MPVPRSRDVGTLKRFFKREHPEWSDKKVTAASLNQARKNGANIPNPKPKRKRSKA